jgi:hypothetical protein
MRPGILSLIVTSFVVGCGPAKHAPSHNALPEAGRWMIVAVPAGVDVPRSLGRTPAAVWRLNTQTGALEFCYLTDKIDCGPINRPK